jgi:hypothetical protein
VKWTMAKSDDGCETTLFQSDSPERDRLLTDVDGDPMTVIMEFEAETFEEAAQIENDYYGWGKYIPHDEVLTMTMKG